MAIRDAVLEDLPEIRRLLLGLGLPVDGVEEHLHRFLVMESDGRLVGTVGLEVYGDTALLRSLGISVNRQGEGHGQYLYEAIRDRAGEIGVREIVLLTETAQSFFARQGFEVIPRAEVESVVGASAEFRGACPESAVCMRLLIQ